MEYALFEQQGQVGILTVNRPAALNALNSAVVAEMAQMLHEIEKMDIRCLVVTGAGEKAFVAGADIAEMAELDPAGAENFSNEGNAVMEALENLPMPTIAAVNGYALGGGCELALSCDIRIASEKAAFALPETSLGILPGYGGLQRLARLVGPAKAKELAFTTNRIKAQEALEIGLVNAVHAPEELMEKSLEMANKIAANSPVGVRGAKQVINKSLGLPVTETYRMETAPFGACFATQDQKEAMHAFVEKRKPQPFTGK